MKNNNYNTMSLKTTLNIVIFHALVLFFWGGCFTIKNIKPHPKEILTNHCILKLDSGINSIVLGVSTFHEIEEKLGKGVKSKEKFKSFTVENIFPSIQYSLSYPSYGITFATDAQGKLNAKRVATVLELTSNCPCKTKEGLGIGSNYEEIQKVLGEKELTPARDIAGEYTILDYLLEGSVEYIRFICDGKKSQDEFKAEKIVLTN